MSFGWVGGWCTRCRVTLVYCHAVFHDPSSSWSALVHVSPAPVGPASAPREGAVLARSPLYPLLPGALVRMMVTQGARAFAEALLADG